MGQLRRYPGYIFLNSKRFLRGKLCNITMLTPEIIVNLSTRGLPCAQCTNNRLKWENYTANYKIFQERQLNSEGFLVFLRAIPTSRRFPGFLGVPGSCSALYRLRPNYRHRDNSATLLTKRLYLHINSELFSEY